MKKNLFYLLTLVGLLFIAISCDEECTHPDYLGEDNSIVSFSFLKGSDELPLVVYADSIVFNAEYDFDFSGLTAEVVVGDGITIAPDPATVTDWSANIDFQVTSANGMKTKVCRYVVHVAEYEKVFEEVAYLRTQLEVNAFGAEAYTKVRGIVINSSEEGNITDLSPLNTIEEIINNLQITGFYGKTLNGGFSKLKKVTTFNIKNDSICELSLPVLEEVSNMLIGKLNDEDGFNNMCTNLVTVSFPCLTRIKSNFYVSAALQTMEGFSQLEEVGGEVYLQGFSFTSLKGLEHITELEYLSIVGMYNLPNLEGLENLKTVHQKLKLQFLQLPDLTGLNVEKVGHLNINNCQKMTNVLGLSKLTNLKSLFLSGLPKLESLEGLHNLTKIDGKLSLGHLGNRTYDYSTWTVITTGVADLNGLTGLQAVTDDISILYSPNLSDFSGLAGIADDVAVIVVDVFVDDVDVVFVVADVADVVAVVIIVVIVVVVVVVVIIIVQNPSSAQAHSVCKPMLRNPH